MGNYTHIIQGLPVMYLIVVVSMCVVIGAMSMDAIGHIHADIAGIIDGTTNAQLQVVISSPNRMMDMQYDNTTVGEGIGNSQDVFNAYVIDRHRHTVRVVRVGSNITEDLKERLVEEFEYSQS